MLMARVTRLPPDDSMMGLQPRDVSPRPSPTPRPCPIAGATAVAAAALLAVHTAIEPPRQPLFGAAPARPSPGPTTAGAGPAVGRDEPDNAVPNFIAPLPLCDTAPTDFAAADGGGATADAGGTVAAAAAFCRYAEAKHALPGRLQARAVLVEADRLFPANKPARNVACIAVLVRVLLGGAPDAVAGVTTHRALLQRFTDADPAAQAEALAAVAALLTARPALVSKTVHILKRMFDEDIVEEPAFLLWDDSSCGPDPTTSPVAVDVRRHTARFVSWLRTAEEEEDSDDDEDDDVGIGDPCGMPNNNGGFDPAARANSNVDDGDADSDGDGGQMGGPAVGSECDVAATGIAMQRPGRCGKKVSFCDDTEIFIVPGPKEESRYGSWAADGIRERIRPPPR